VKNHRPTVMLMTNFSGGGGAEQQLRALARGIDKQQFRVLVVTRFPGPLDEETKQIPGVEFICLPRLGRFDFTQMFRLMMILSQRHVDVIQPFLSTATLFGLLPAFLVRTPVKIVTERCGVRKNQRGIYKVISILEDFLGRFAQIAVANSRAGQDLLLSRDYRPEKTRVIYNGLDLTRLVVDPIEVAEIRAEQGLKPGAPVVGINAWLNPAKDHSTFLKSAHIIHERRPEVRFAILGDGVLQPDLEAMAENLNLAKQVIFFGKQQQVGNYLSLFDISVLSSIDHEGCSNSILEAMALGKPVVATDVGGNSELVIPGENGLLVPPGEPEALAEAVLSLLSDSERARQMGENGRVKVLSEFSQERMVAEYQGLWLELLRRNPRDVDEKRISQDAT
jgi:glycosyltransferase involved in cell wall biosynthesis